MSVRWICILIVISIILVACQNSPVKNQPIIPSETISELAIKEIGEGTILSIRQQDEKGLKVYEVQVQTTATTYHLLYDATSGDLLKKEEQREEDNNGDIEQLPVTISEHQARDIALQRVGEGKVTALTLTTDNQYAIEVTTIRRKYEVKVDAMNGEISKYKEVIVE